MVCLMLRAFIVAFDKGIVSPLPSPSDLLLKALQWLGVPLILIFFARNGDASRELDSIQLFTD